MSQRTSTIEVDEFLLDEEEDNTQEDKYLLFKLGKEEYGVSICQVQSIEELQKIIAVPDMPDFVRGVINLRGKVIPVIDLRLRFAMDEKEYDDRTCIIIVNIGESTTGLIVDTVSEVHDIPKTTIEPTPEFRNKSEKERYILGLGKIGEEVKILLDVERILLSEDLENIKSSTPDPAETDSRQENS
jgi:purine-binding chemotaxis protein CheW